MLFIPSMSGESTAEEPNEGCLDVLLSERAGLFVHHVVRLGEGLGLFGGHGPVDAVVRDVVELVADQDHFGVGLAVSLDLFPPVLAVLEGLLVGQVEDEEDPVRVLVMIANDGSIPFTSS